MLSYSETNVFSEKEIDLLKHATLLVSAIPHNLNLRCHEVTRVVGLILGLQVQDGHYGFVEHSWLWTKPFLSRTSPPNVLDVYRVGSLPQVQLIDVSSIGLPLSLDIGYKIGNERKDVDDTVISSIARSVVGYLADNQYATGSKVF